MKFKAGDKVWVMCGNVEYRLFGTKPGVVEGPTTFDTAALWGFPPDTQWYRVDLLDHQHPVMGTWLSQERHMWSRDEDGRQVGRWENSVLVWQPGREKTIMSEEMVEVTDERERQAVREGAVHGEVYADGEVWAERLSLSRFRIGVSEAQP